MAKIKPGAWVSKQEQEAKRQAQEQAHQERLERVKRIRDNLTSAHSVPEIRKVLLDVVSVLEENGLL